MSIHGSPNSFHQLREIRDILFQHLLVRYRFGFWLGVDALMQPGLDCYDIWVLRLQHYPTRLDSIRAIDYCLI
jgi:hypothetical protein